MPDARRREISVIEHRVSILQKELKAEMKKMRLAEQGQVGQLNNLFFLWFLFCWGEVGLAVRLLL